MIFNLTPTEIFQIVGILFAAGLMGALAYHMTFSKGARGLWNDI
jgi:hypothetical protein